MTVEKLKTIVLQLANQTHVRYWVYWNYPGKPSEMAISILWSSPSLPQEMAKLGFRLDKVEDDEQFFVIPRTNEDGSSYVSTI